LKFKDKCNLCNVVKELNKYFTMMTAIDLEKVFIKQFYPYSLLKTFFAKSTKSKLIIVQEKK